jgi:hypothetical protein
MQRFVLVTTMEVDILARNGDGISVDGGIDPGGQINPSCSHAVRNVVTFDACFVYGAVVS